MSKWIQSAVTKMKKKGTIGLFSKAAKRAGKPTLTYAHSVLSNPNSSPTMRKRAQFAINANK
jgi:hypothetical protein